MLTRTLCLHFLLRYLWSRAYVLPVFTSSATSTVPCLFKAKSSNRDCSVAQPYENTEVSLSNDTYQHSADHLTAKINVEYKYTKKIVKTL